MHIYRVTDGEEKTYWECQYFTLKDIAQVNLHEIGIE